MDFTWTDDQRELRAGAIEFATRALGRHAGDEPDAPFSREAWQACADFGVQGLVVPEEYGGSGYDVVTAVMLLEALGSACADQGLLFSLHAHIWAVETPLLRFATPAQKARYLPGLSDGTLVGAHAMTEPDSGSDALALRTRAERRTDSYVLNGSKAFVTNAPVADLFLVFATVDRTKAMWGVTAFLVERGTKGLTVGRKLEKLGLASSPMAEVFLEDCEVPASARLGREGQGAAIFNHSMTRERSCILATTVGAMARQLEACLEYASTRRQFGRPIGNFQLVASKIADMKVRLDASRLLLYRAAAAQVGTTGGGVDGAIAKLYISEAAVQSALDAVQIRGGYGYTHECEAAQNLRDTVGATLYSGTSEIQRLLIARGLGLAPV